MRITAVNMPAVMPTPDGLSAIEMKRIGSVVVIAGRNGSGKSRLLRRVFDWVKGAKDMNPVEIHEGSIRSMQSALATEPNHPNKEIWKNGIANASLEILRHSWLTLSETSKKAEAVYFVPKALALDDSNDIAPNLLHQRAAIISVPGMDYLSSGTLAKLQSVQTRWWEATHQESQSTPGEKEQAIQEYQRLNDLLEKFLNVKLSRSINGYAEIFGFPMGKASLSDGQKILLQFCVAIHTQAKVLSELIVMMDEPENHLHPSAVLDAIDAIQKQLTNGQLWIATHSLPILAHFDASSIWWMDNGKVDFAGNIPKKVLEGLLGNDERILKLSDFLNLPFELASIRFAFQCLLSPTTAEAQDNDPQTRQISDILKQYNQRERLKMLDFGAGKGRLIDAIHKGMETSNVAGWIDFVAFDSSAKDKADCVDAITKLYGKSDNRYFNDANELLTHFSPNEFDVVVMCNVFHEIPTGEWLNLFAAESALMKLLKDDGFLLLVEDMQMPVGEKAHQKGFLVLDTGQLRTLFSITAADTGFSFDAQKDGRLKAHRIPKVCISRISPESRRAAVKEIIHLAKQRIQELRCQDNSYQNGRLHGFWVQQFANAQLALDEMG